ncbi:MAG: HAD family phosphatase [Chlorobi bacterium]|nr:HAD family phosphatase [Chlorobiota bacterium]
MTALPRNTKAIIFDLGGVIMDLDIDLSKKALGELGFRENMFHLHDTGNNVFLELEVGGVDTDRFYDRLRDLLGKPVENRLLEEAWNKMICGFRAEKIDLLRQLSKDYSLYLLSNTNEIHIRYCNHILQEQYGISGLEALFTVTFYSHILKLRKPRPEIFTRVLQLIPFPPEEIVYFDDTREHLDAAASFGIRGILHPRNAPLHIRQA